MLMHGDDAEGPLFAVMLGDGDVLAFDEVMTIELEDRFVIIGVHAVVVEQPAVAPAMDQMADLVVLAFPESPDRAFRTHRTPGVMIQSAVVAQRRAKLVPAPAPPCVGGKRKGGKDNKGTDKKVLAH